MAYGRIYIDNLRKKVTVLFDELRADNRLGEDNFIKAFKRKYPKDYESLVYEWEFKVHEFKKNMPLVRTSHMDSRKTEKGSQSHIQSDQRRF